MSPSRSTQWPIDPLTLQISDASPSSPTILELPAPTWLKRLPTLTLRSEVRIAT